MTITSNLTSQQLPCNGTTTQFNFNNKIFSASDLIVTLIDTLLNEYEFTNGGSGNVFSNVALGLSYTVFNIDVDAGCYIVFNTAPTLNWTCDMRTQVPELQSTSIRNQGSFLPELHEEFFDRATRMLQDLFRLTYTYGIHGADIETTPWTALPSPANRLGLSLMFDAVFGLPTVGVPTTQTFTGQSLAIFGTDSGTANNYIFTHAGVVPAALIAGDLIRFVPGHNNTGASVINVDGTGNVAIVNQQGVALTGGELSTLGPVFLEYSTALSAWQIVATAGAQTNYVRTAAEIAAGVTPVNYAYPPLYVDRYCTNTTPGTTPMQSGFTNAFAVAQAGNGGIVRYGATGLYNLTGPVNFTTAGAPNQGTIVLQCEAVSIDGPKMSIIFNHTGHGFDCTGTEGITFKNVCATTGASGPPKTGVFQARNSSNASVGVSRFEQCFFIGAFSVANYYNYAAEDDEIVGGFWDNTYTAGAASVAVWTANNLHLGSSQSSTFQTVATGPQSCIDHKVFGGCFSRANNNAQDDVFYLEGIASVKIFGPWSSCSSGSAGGRSQVYVDMTNAPSNNVEIEAFQGENLGGAANPSYGICLSANAQTPAGWDVNGAFFPATVRAIFGGAGSTISSWEIAGIKEVSSLGLQVPNVTGCQILSSNLVMNISTSWSGNLYVGSKANLTVPGGAVGTNVILDIAAGNVYAGGALGMAGATGASQLAGWGTPTAGSVVSNFPGNAATLAQCGSVLTEIISQLKALGLLGA